MEGGSRLRVLLPICKVKLAKGHTFQVRDKDNQQNLYQRGLALDQPTQHEFRGAHLELH